jgi:energy-coupling factor transporter ATP-binding protein EcfA2
MADNYWVPLRLPAPRDIAKYLLWVSGRVLLSGWLFGLHGLTVACKVTINLAEMTRAATLHLLKVYDQLPYMGVSVSNIIDVPAVAITEPPQIITDIVAAIEGKQLMIIGNSGAGKSTVAQYLAYTIGGKVRVLECEGTPDDWKGLEVIGRGENWSAINTAMEEELEEISCRVNIRNERGDAALAGMDEVTIVEEYPEVRTKCSSADEWFERHGRRGRKMKRFIICLSQYDRVSAWGLEGKSDLGDCFYRLRLSKTALAHAKSLKNNDLMEWLKQDKSHCLLDDAPCKLPAYREMKALPGRFSQTMLQPSTNNAIMDEKPLEKGLKSTSEAGFEEFFSDSDRLLWRMIQRFGAEKTDSAIVTEVLGFTGERYSKGKDLLERLRNQFGG